MKINTTFRYPTALTIAGSDSGGGAGIQADIKTFSALGVYGTSVITSVTAQNTLGVRGIQAIAPEIVKGQIDAVFEDIKIDAIKIGMLHNRETAYIVVDAIDKFALTNIVLDPVMISTSGSKLIEDETIEVIVGELFKRVTLITPNIDEAISLSGINISNEQDMEKAGRKLLDMGCRAVLIKGGHLLKDEMADIFLIRGQKPLRLTTKTIQTQNSHGTGCTLSSAIAAYLAQGKELEEAVSLSKTYITEAIRSGANVITGHGHGPLNHFFSPSPLTLIKI
ncbi:bifunctional hydroxymethylpyrimidine kinase/phosphomethylpyrimidine kinase [Parabacteroides sp. AM08-6]|uniref:bifunctional hydroxymethylpyrimidine kinase/phosphomethylpyrimidine kinase n=1 Tax=Parabacteroides sp. AM08-6 TaxID=2292053 RepID=UPI000EFE8ECC|nr:bifunctional hydroxymethylpyrimidine kinase/phosphomethylpyrimidine kinase [Parabacteroides sp. AM08-6]RHJ87825.1 bifunctional hydroxymethylpyrimidine kinase/phosphomethylpyrimidine kinase [Parabacteroides sp. AM08-6]